MSNLLGKIGGAVVSPANAILSLASGGSGSVSDITSLLGGTKSSANTSTLPTKTPQQQQALADLLKSLGTGQVPAYTGQINAPTNQAQNLSLSALEDQAKGIATGSTNNEALKAISGLLSKTTGSTSTGSAPNVGNAQAVIDLLKQNQSPISGDVQTALSDILSGKAQNFDAYFKAAVEDPMLRDYAQNIAPVISRGFAANNNYSSSDRQLADQRAQQDLLNSLTQARASTAYQAQNDAVTNALNAAGILTGSTNAENANLAGLIGTGLNTGLNQQQLDTQTTLSAAQQLLQQPGMDITNLNNILSGATSQQQISQQQLDNIKNQFNVQTDQEAQRIALLLQALGLGTSENITTVTPGQPGLLQGAAQGLGAAGGAALFS